MGKASVFFCVIFAACVLEQTSGWNYFWQANPLPQDIISYPYLSPIAPVWQPDCEKEEGSSESSESSESSSSESSESKEGSSSSSSSSSESESKESKESGESSESGGSSESGESSSSSESKEGSEGGSEEGSKESKSSEESSEKKKETSKKKKKESKPLFPPPVYNFPPRFQRIVYSAAPYMPYKTSYVVQQPSYPVKSSYQYISVPAPAPVVKSYAAAPVVGKFVSSPVRSIVYSSSPALNYSPGSRVFSLQGPWNSYLKK